MIYRYPLKVVDEQMVALTENAEPLSVEETDNTITLFALCDPARPVRHKKLWLLPTGSGHLDNGADRKYLGTIKLHDGLLVYHAFVEVPQPAVVSGMV